MTYYVTAYNTHPFKGHRTTIEKTMQTSDAITANAIAEIWASEGYDVQRSEEG